MGIFKIKSWLTKVILEVEEAFIIQSWKIHVQVQVEDKRILLYSERVNIWDMKELTMEQLFWCMRVTG